MKSDIANFFGLQRQIFGVCPKCQDFFRLSDCKIFLKKKPLADWMDKITLEKNRLDGLEEKIEEKKEISRRRPGKLDESLLKGR